MGRRNSRPGNRQNTRAQTDTGPAREAISLGVDPGKIRPASVRMKRCERLLHCSALSARSATTRRRRTRRRPPVVWSSRSSASAAARTGRTGKPSKSEFPKEFPSDGCRGVGSTVKPSVSKTDFGGSNPSAPASFLPCFHCSKSRHGSPLSAAQQGNWGAGSCRRRMVGRIRRLAGIVPAQPQRHAGRRTLSGSQQNRMSGDGKDSSNHGKQGR